MKKYFFIYLGIIALLCIGCTRNKVDYMEPKTNITDNITEINNQNEIEPKSGDNLLENREKVSGESRRNRDRNRNYRSNYK